ncbi:MAG: hypothetical protein QOE05_2785 [Actinomycetota bacterium]|jgi:hypothetical protein|nr:hypothetical protein [Actinomycetota bacterium]
MLTVRSLALLSGMALVLPAGVTLLAITPSEAANPEMTPARKAAPVILTGAQLGTWSQLPATGLAAAYPSGVGQDTANPIPGTPQSFGDYYRSAHNGTLSTPPADGRTGIDPNNLAAYSWTSAGGWREVPVQVDQKFPNFLANGHSTFSFYSGTDEELTYAWAPDGHSTGEEAWKKVFGDCTTGARYATVAENAALPPIGTYASANKERDESLDTPGYTGAMQDPVGTLDDDDEVVFMARDAGEAAPANTPPPANTGAAQSVQVLDPLEPDVSRVVYLFQKTGGSTYNAANGYVQMTRAADADAWMDRDSFLDSSNEKLGSSNVGYGPNITGQVCKNVDGTKTVPRTSTAKGLEDPSKKPVGYGDRFPSDAMTVTTPTYKLGATGRWMVRSMQIKNPTTGAYGPNLLSRWKGRAFQQSPDSSVSLVGFEDEQVNWEANGALLGWRNGPVRAIREIWGADSGTNVTKTETYYRDADTYGYHVRVHPIPSDGLYTSWDYDPAAVTTYYNAVRSQDQPVGSPQVPVTGVPIDGINDDTGSVDKVPAAGQPAYFDAPDPTFDAVTAINRPEEIAGPNGGMVYEFEFTGATSALNATAVPYYRDDDCLDDGTGDKPMPRPWPGEASNDSRVQQGYVDYWKAHGAPATLTYADLQCATTTDEAKDPARPLWKKRPFAAAFGQHGIHFFATHDTDNATLPKPVTEVVGQQWRFSIPMTKAENHVVEYGNNVNVKLQGFAAPYTPGSTTATTTPAPTSSPTPSPDASTSASPTASSSASATATPTGTASPSVTPGATDTPSTSPSGNGLLPLTVSVSPSDIVPTQEASVTIHGSPNTRVHLLAYSRPSTTYRDVRDSITNTNGDVTFRVTPGGNTRLYATYGRADKSTDSGSHVIQVHTTLSLSATRTAVRTYDFHGRNLPRRAGQLITLYRLDGNGREVRTAIVRTDTTGTWHLSRTFTGGGTFPFFVRTSTNMDNASGRSDNAVVDVH